MPFRFVSTLRAAAFASLVGALGLTARAHHSAAVYYLLDQEIAVEGVVERFTFRNPHCHVFLAVHGADGRVQPWMAEGGSQTVLQRRGWTGRELRPGDVVKVIGHPARDGSHALRWTELHFTDGRDVGPKLTD
jgi:hypothetical protein